MRATSCAVAIASLATTLALDLIRINQNGQTASDNMGDYDIWSCKNEGDDRSCSFRAQGLLDYAEVTILVSHYSSLNYFDLSRAWGSMWRLIFSALSLLCSVQLFILFISSRDAAAVGSLLQQFLKIQRKSQEENISVSSCR
jgi:hypothetical protein